jgi:potassium efflux system protein
VFVLVLIFVVPALLISDANAQQTELENQVQVALERLEKATYLDEVSRKQTLSQLENAQSMLVDAKEQRRLAKNYEETAASASQKTIDIQEKIEALNATKPDPDITQSLEELENQLLLVVAEQNARLSSLANKQSEQTALSFRANKIAEQLNAAKTDKIAINNALADLDANASDLLDNTESLEKLTGAEKLTATIESLEREIATIPARQSIVDADIRLKQAQSRFAEKQINILRSHITDKRNSAAQQTIIQSSTTLTELKEQPALAEIAQENLELANQLRDSQTRAPQNEIDMTSLRRQLVEVRQSAETVDRVLATGRVTDELGGLLRRLRASLPKESKLERRNEQIEEASIRQQLDVILWQDRLRNLTNIQESAELLLHENMAKLTEREASHEFTNEEFVTAQQLVKSRQQILTNLIEIANSHSERITEEKLAIRDLLSASSELRELLGRRLIWLPSSTGIADKFAVNLLVSVEWFLSPVAWWTLLTDIYTGARSEPFWLLLLVILPIMVVASRRAIKRTLWSLVDKVGDVEHDTYSSTPLALLLTLVLALPLPICLFTIAAMIFRVTEPLSFSSAFATGLAAVSSISLILLFFRSMCRDSGMFDQHFGWSDKARRKLRTMLTWFVWYESTATFVFATAIASGEQELRYGIAILAFIVGSIGIAIFSYQFFQPSKGVATSVVGETPANTLTMIAFPILVLTPLAIGLLPLIGYFDTAVVLQSKFFVSGVLLVAAAIIYGIMLRVFLVTLGRYIARKAIKEAKRIAYETALPLAESGGDGSPVQAKEKGFDEKELKRQSQSIMQWTSGLLFVIGLWFVWKPLLPALGIVDDIVLWQEVRIVDGIELSSGVTLWNIILSLLFAIGGFVAAKNIRGVMEIGFFERFEMDDGARYATMAILGYLIIGGGIVIGFSQLGIDWSKLQWIVAALGVGLGFGLQEIVANFVSGLIILFERPIRVGDFVTIGNLSGTVRDIKIRATTVTDFDNREVLLPNKSIITENVTNWTLNSAVTRIVVKIGVAYGTDIEKVRELLMHVAVSQQDVLEQPAPQVFFLAHGDSSLDFEVRVFVSRPENRLPLTHSINLAINKILAENEISIPFPQRDLHIVSGSLDAEKIPTN